ncbi:hypothetical protein CJ467_20800 [Bacillus velezensis]|uniref:hypothetical protein n=1 Tax=Bacillus amyloliquefaciens group TaxID=1938374 RepID=UPI0003980780|nr:MULTISPECIES: hypothetical protein [Bacillus amyloliquefaciens group]ERH55256.1 hypothetical protein O205_21405 [Bacillus amyloliquefaciens EGD-AQ14]PAK28375.1 hypothetical protein CJ467_20800 [Bacillus velezensis]RBZ02107.1 hypothetical protein DSD26_00060 [Bacillus velezensis]WNJ14803.1 hypothetical protein RJY17_06090 [Bacillus velezensis]
MDNVLCDKCLKPFDIKKIKERKLDADVKVSYFTCPHCSTEFRSFYNNKAIRDRLFKMKQMQREIKKMTDQNVLECEELRVKYEEDTEAM